MSFKTFFRQKSTAIRDFYESACLGCEISDLKHRQIRFDMGNKFLVLKRPITNSGRLIAALRRLAPRNAYYSTGKWLEPHKLVPKYRAKKISENIFIGCDLAFDIDFKPFSIENIERARIECIKLLNFLDSKDITLKYIAFSGSKGFHVLCEDPNKYSPPNPYEREEEAKNYRVTLAKEIDDNSIEIDSAITTDTRRIIRIPGTVNYSSGYICRTVERRELETHARDIIKRTPRVEYSSLRTFWDDLKLRFSRSISGGRAMKGKPGSTTSFSSFVSSSVLGVKDRVIPVFIYRNETRSNVEKLLQTVQKIYSLGDIYLLEEGKETFAFSIDSLPSARALKISKAAKSLGTSKLCKYHQNWLRIGAKYGADNRIVCNKPRLVKILSAISIHPISAGHLLLLEKEFGIMIKKSDLKIHGEEEYKLIDALMRD